MADPDLDSFVRKYRSEIMDTLDAQTVHEMDQRVHRTMLMFTDFAPEIDLSNPDTAFMLAKLLDFIMQTGGGFLTSVYGDNEITESRLQDVGFAYLHVMTDIGYAIYQRHKERA